jgi:hypothetical protein
MLRQELVQRIAEMIQTGKWSLRRIARELGVARGTVAAIAHGRRRERAQRTADNEDGLPYPNGPFVRCPTCGHRVQMPCLLCRLRSWRADGQPAATASAPGVQVGLELTPEHLERYRAVRARRLLAEMAAEKARRRRRALRMQSANREAMARAGDAYPPGESAASNALHS